MKILSKKKLSEKELMVFCRQMQVMYKSGCDIISIIDVIMKSSSTTMSKALIIVKKNIENGKNITDSFTDSRYFSKFFLYMVHAGELSGNIEYVFDEMTKYYDRENKLKNKLIGVLIYPIILLIVMLISFIFMLLFVIPNFEAAFDMDKIDLPLMTVLIFGLSRILRDNIFIIIILVIMIISFCYKIIKTDDAIKTFIDRKKFEIPKIKILFQLVVSDKFSRALYILLSSGVYIGESIDISTQIINNTYVDYRMMIAKKYIEEGNSISEALKLTGLFPNMFISMLLSGEESGSFEDSLKFISEYYSNELDVKLEHYVKLIEPIMIVVVGILVGITVISILSPMFDLISTIQ